MEVAMPMAGSAIDCYEDMFKEITRKLYGEEGLSDLAAIDRLPPAAAAGGGGQDRGLTPIDYEADGGGGGGGPFVKPDEHLTAFGLAALMQNGFPGGGILHHQAAHHKPPPAAAALAPILKDEWLANEDTLQWTASKIATYNPSQRLFRCAECDSVGYLLRVAEHWLGTHSSLRAFRCPQCSYESAWARCVRIHLGRQHNISVDESCDALTKDNPVLQEITKYLQRLKGKSEGAKPFDDFPPAGAAAVSNPEGLGAGGAGANKRYACSYCPYATDRRDLFTRHENIHREEKPFQCYVCQKQFNRADHVKKHFLRMHRDHPYDLNRIRRHPPKNASGMSYYQKYNAAPPVGAVPPEALAASAIGSLSIPGFNSVARSPSVVPAALRHADFKALAKSAPPAPKGGAGAGGSKKKGEKRFTCCYCSWSGVDNWCLKRHMNTHLKPFVCGLCDYKAARSERLATHVLKVHNKRSCAKCTFLADDLEQLAVHQREHHSGDQRSRPIVSSIVTSASTSNILRANGFNSGALPAPSATITSSTGNPPLCSQPPGLLKPADMTAAAAAQILHHNRFLQSEKSWKSHLAKPPGAAAAAARLFNFIEPGDGPDPDVGEPRGPENMSRRVNLPHRSDFLEAGDVGHQADTGEEATGEQELPLFVCPTCGCEFEDDASLETHLYTHRSGAASPAKTDDSKENVDPKSSSRYGCRVCDASFDSQRSIITHMGCHRTLGGRPYPYPHRCEGRRHGRKQRRPKKVEVPYWEPEEVDFLRHLGGKLRQWRGQLGPGSGAARIVDKYMAQLVTRRGLVCRLCKSAGISRYHTRASLALHQLWRHSRTRFQCEHCDATFRHRYQAVLHGGRVHIDPKPAGGFAGAGGRKEPAPPPDNSSTQDTNTFTSFFNNSQNVSVPEASMSGAYKLGMSFFDHSFIHNNTISNHMPIIIPTFPPN